jgi:diguanylate cyclase (GGDEF)-like protein
VADDSGSRNGSAGGSPSERLALKVSVLQAELLGRLREELGTDPEGFAEAAQRLALEFGGVTAAAVGAVEGPGATASSPAPQPEAEPAEHHELASLYRPGHMRRRLEQLVETNRRYGHPFGLAVFDASGPGVRNGGADAGPETVLSILGAALRDSIRIVDEAFRLEEDAICVLAPNLRTVEGMQMAERLLAQLDELERAGGLRITIAAGVVACPEHGADAEDLLHKADAAMWRARAVGQPVGIGALQDR